MQVRIEVWPPGWLITSLPNFDPAGQDSAPGAPGGPVAPCGPVATLIVVVTAGACWPTPKAVAVRTPVVAASASATPSSTSGLRRRARIEFMQPLLEGLEALLAVRVVALLRLADVEPGGQHARDAREERAQRDELVMPHPLSTASPACPARPSPTARSAPPRDPRVAQATRPRRRGAPSARRGPRQKPRAMSRTLSIGNPPPQS